MTQRLRIVLLVAISVVVVLAAGGYVLYAKQRRAQAEALTPNVAVRTDFSALAAQPHLAFRNTALGDGYGKVALVPLSDPSGARAITPATCDRVYANQRGAVCLAANRGIATTYSSTWLNPQWNKVRDLPLTGLPSRARISPDGSLVATTTFVFGDAYTNPGQFSTRTLVSRADGSSNVDLETFALFVDGRQNTAADRNLWGVTFVDDDRFYATAASGHKTWLVQGSLSAKRLTALYEDVECPSVSPDRTRIAFKQHGNLAPGSWRLTVLDLATGKRTQLSETRSVDDQAEWLDNTHIVYGLPRQTTGSASSDIWVVPSDGTGAPSVLVRDAWSPAVVP
jgi:WD40-like Beta Propeller Repeat